MYKFRCSSCEHTQERIVKLGVTNVSCNCGDVAVKIFTPNAAGFKVNGKGAYDSGVMKPK